MAQRDRFQQQCGFGSPPLADGTSAFLGIVMKAGYCWTFDTTNQSKRT
jgi:hypothetical protein